MAAERSLSRILLRRYGQLLCEVVCEPGQYLWPAVKDFLAGRSGCAGQGICGGCRVRITALADDRRETVSELACRAVIAAGSLVIDLPPAGDDENLQMDWRMTADCSPPAASYGLALDIGTTSLAAGLFDLANGQMVWAAGGLNRQAVLAADVISRIVVADRPGGLDELRQLLWRDSVRPLVGKLCALAGIAPDQIRAVAAAGNTVMSHIANNLSPHSLGQAPYRPVTLCYQPLPVEELGLGLPAGLRVEWVPSAGAFIGGDTVADLWATVWQQPEISNQMLVDIGTNGEVVLAAGGRLLATSAAAGPAFEGWGLSCGCRAVPGAIERVTIDDRDRMAVKTIGELPARGICGSGIISFIAEARRRGWLDHSGRFRPDRLTESGRRLTAVDGGRRLAACELADGVYVTEQDIANVLAAKAAVAAGWQVLLKLADLPADDIGRICLAGGFAAFLDVPAAISIGLLPAVEPDRYQIAHQAVLRGTAALFSPHNRPRIALLSRRLEVIQMSGRSDFAALFVDNLTLP